MKVICISKNLGLTIGKSYNVIRTISFDKPEHIQFYCIYDDNNNFNSYDKKYIIPLHEHRTNILTAI